MARLELGPGGSATAPYDTWTKSLTTMAAAVAALTAGDVLEVNATQSDVIAGVNLTVPGSAAALTQILVGTPGSPSGLSALGTGALLESSTTSYTLGGAFHVEGYTFRGSAGGTTAMNFNPATAGVESFKNCRFELTGASNGSVFHFGASSSAASCTTRQESVVYKFGAAAQRIAIDGVLHINGMTLDTALAAPTGLFQLAYSARGAVLSANDVDASNAANSLTIVDSINQSGCVATFRRWKLPSGWTGQLVNPTNLKLGDRISLFDYSLGTTRYRAWIDDHAGRLKDESVVKVTAEAYSYKIATTANCSVANPMKSVDFFVPLTAGVATSIQLEICSDGVTLTDADIALEVDTFNTANSSLGTKADGFVSLIAGSTAITTSSTAWTTTGFVGTAVKQKLSISVNAGITSDAIVRVVIRKPNATVYISGTTQEV